MSSILHVSSDWHVDSGSHLGHFDARWGSTRLRDVLNALREVNPLDGAAELGQGLPRPDAHLMLGDLTRTPTPEPMVLAAISETIGGWPPIEFMEGNHDHDGRARSPLDVVARRRDSVHVEPTWRFIAGVVIVFLPWTPVARLYGRLGGDRGAAHQEASERIVQIAAGLMAQGRKAHPNRPTLCVGHWLLAGTELATGKSVLEAHEPVVDATALEALGFDGVIFGHNHAHQQVASKSWVVGPPARTGWGERDQPTGFLRVLVDDDQLRIEHEPVNDREMVVVDLDPDALGGIDTEIPEGALVRVRTVARPDQTQAIAERWPILRDQLLADGAHIVDGPNVNVTRERRARAEGLTVDTDPVDAFVRFIDAQETEPPNPDIYALAKTYATDITKDA